MISEFGGWGKHISAFRRGTSSTFPEKQDIRSKKRNIENNLVTTKTISA
jgi:hypothetical protein